MTLTIQRFELIFNLAFLIELNSKFIASLKGDKLSQSKFQKVYFKQTDDINKKKKLLVEKKQESILDRAIYVNDTFYSNDYIWFD